MSSFPCRSLACFGLFTMLGVGLGCYGESGNPRPLVFPERARPGDTVALSMTANTSGLAGNFDLSRDNVSLWIGEDWDSGSPLFGSWPVEYVFDGFASKMTPLNMFGTFPGAGMTIVLFNLPTLQDGLDPSEVPSLEIIPLVDGEAVHWVGSGFRWRVDVVPGAGAPIEFSPDPAQFEHPPMVRLQAAWNWVDEDYGLADEIGAIEFELDYPETVVSAPRVFTTTDATRATAIVADDPGPGVARILAVDPEGFRLSDSYNPQGIGAPFLDVVFDKTGEFEPIDFTVTKLYVTDLDGVTLVDDRDKPIPPDRFTIYVVNHAAP